LEISGQVKKSIAGLKMPQVLSVCVSYQKIVKVFRLNLVFGVYSAVEFAEFCDATPSLTKMQFCPRSNVTASCVAHKLHRLQSVQH
jgi:hypothetical protein